VTILLNGGHEQSSWLHNSAFSENSANVKPRFGSCSSALRRFVALTAILEVIVHA